MKKLPRYLKTSHRRISKRRDVPYSVTQVRVVAARRLRGGVSVCLKAESEKLTSLAHQPARRRVNADIGRSGGEIKVCTLQSS